MLRIPELSRQIAVYKDAQISLDEFEDWFRSNFRGSYQADDSDESRVTVAVESALSKFHFRGIAEDILRKDLVEAIRPFEDAELQLGAQLFPRQQNRAVIGSRSQIDVTLPTPGNNATAGFNVAA